MSLVIDGVFFQLTQSGIARVWRAVLPQLAPKLDMPIVFLDRGGITGDMPGVEVVPFPTYKSKFTPHDSVLLERVCRHYDATLFISTYYTTPLNTPSLSLVYDMIPERFEFDLTARDWREKELAIAHARRHICISNNTRKDLLEFYPELDPATTTVAHCGVDPLVFKQADATSVAQFRRSLGLTRPYFMFVGSRVQAKNYKNASLFFDALTEMNGIDFDVLCVGGEKATPDVAQGSKGARIIQVDLDDEQLAVAYSGAAALVYPSLYEGFGLPVVEAMSCECPVISTNHGSLAEVAADAVLRIEGNTVPEMIEALRTVRDPLMREKLIALGRQQAAKFRWEPFANEVVRAIHAIASNSKAGTYANFYDQWSKLRLLQGEVDVLA